MRRSFAALVAVFMAVAIAACGSSPTGSSSPGATATPAGQTLAPGQTVAPGATPTQAGTTQSPGGPTQLPVGVTGHECDAVPTFDLTNPNPATPVPDTTLSAHFPPMIDGNPVTDVESMQWIYLICMFGGQAAVNQAAGEASGLNLATMSFGSATATVDDEEVDLSAFRTPGQDANAVVQTLALLAAQSGTDITPGQMTAANVGGKNVFVATDEDGVKSYAYPSGDTLIFFDNVTDSQAAKILAALP